MLPPRNRVVLWAFTLVVVGWMLAQGFSGAETGLLHFAPALLLALTLILGRYPGESRLAELAGTSVTPAARVPARMAIPRSYVRVMQRGGCLVASALAKRPPPLLAASQSTA